MCVCGGNVKCLDLIYLSGQQGADWGSPELCLKRHQSSRSSILPHPPSLSVSAVAGEQSRAQKSPWSTPDPGDGRNHIKSAVTQSHCQGVATRESIAPVLTPCPIPRNTSDASYQPAASKPGRHSNEWSNFHSDLRRRGINLELYVLTKPACLDTVKRSAMPACFAFNGTDLWFG